MGTIALTGATGFIGQRLLAALGGPDVRVRALTRRPRAPLPGVEWVHGDLEDGAALARLVAGADTVVHCAAAVRGASASAFTRTNVEGSARLAAAARASGACERFLLMSSLAARHPQLSWYAQSKRTAEQAVAAQADGIALTVFRPTAVYGPGDRALRPLFEWLLRGWLLVLGERDARVSLLHVDDLAAAVRAWARATVPSTGTFELHDGCAGGYAWGQIAAIAAQVRRAPVRQVSVPSALLASLARANLAFAPMFGRAPMLTPAKLNELRHRDWSCDNGALGSALGWSPQVALSQALRERSF